jgi:hypothetical protein
MGFHGMPSCCYSFTLITHQNKRSRSQWIADSLFCVASVSKLYLAILIIVGGSEKLDNNVGATARAQPTILHSHVSRTFDNRQRQPTNVRASYGPLCFVQSALAAVHEVYLCLLHLTVVRNTQSGAGFTGRRRHDASVNLGLMRMSSLGSHSVCTSELESHDK